MAAGAPGVLARIDDDRGTWIGASGTADLDTRKPVPREARFRVASVTKSMVAAIVVQLAEEGRLSLDEPIGKWLAGEIDDGDQITVRELLNHTGAWPPTTAPPSSTTLSSTVSGPTRRSGSSTSPSGCPSPSAAASPTPTPATSRSGCSWRR
ncbi:serine hydrolase domain-containing protein [Nonomuraea sp. NPDC049714]|uniref:serine hydrolase domain-containing protein n=1 Tax=Nonomuraea sp. NPDC049714 TaxID=3364357 RepID=UPI0037B730FF